jgi:hypothetical protein
MRKHLTSTLLVKTVAFAVVFAFAASVSLSASPKNKPLSKAEVKNLIANSETKADHERMAQYFDAEAARYEAEAKDHNEMGQFYKKNPDPALSKHPGTPRAAGHCDTLSKNLQNSAEEARQLAAEHRVMAKEAKK